MPLVLPTNTKKVYFTQPDEKEKDEKKRIEKMRQQKELFCVELSTEIKNKTPINQMKNYNAYLFDATALQNHLIIDCDDTDSYKFVKKLLTKYNIQVNKTKSISNIYNNNDANKNRNHIWLNKNGVKIDQNKTIGKLELFVNKKIFEDAEQFNNKINLEDLPNLTTDLYNDLLKYKPKTTEPPTGPDTEIIINSGVSNINENTINIINNINDEIDEYEQKLKDLLDVLAPSRINNYLDWFKLGRMIYNINDAYINIFDYISKKTKTYNINELFQKWNEYKKPTDKALKKLGWAS